MNLNNLQIALRVKEYTLEHLNTTNRDKVYVYTDFIKIYCAYIRKHLGNIDNQDAAYNLEHANIIENIMKSYRAELHNKVGIFAEMHNLGLVDSLIHHFEITINKSVKVREFFIKFFNINLVD